MFTFIETWNSTDSQFAYPTRNMKHKENPLFKSQPQICKRGNIHINFSQKPCSYIYIHTLKSFMCTNKHTNSGLDPVKSWTPPRTEIPQPLWAPIPVFYHPHVNLPYIQNLPCFSLSAASHTSTTHLWEVSAAVFQDSEMQLWKYHMVLWTYNHNCRNNKYCILKYINVREVYNMN